MKYVPPIGATDPNAPYVTENLAAGIEGSPVAAEAIEHPMREIMSVITGAGLVPDVEQLDQLKAAIAKMIADRASLATTEQAGLVELATAAEVLAGTDADRGVTPATLANLLNNLTTPAQFANDKKAATTEFVQRALGNFAGLTGYAKNTVLGAIDCGRIIFVQGAGLTFTLPPTSSVPQGSVIEIYGNGAGVTVARQGTDTLVNGLAGGAAATITIGGYDSARFVSVSTAWYVLGGSVHLAGTSNMNASLNSNGFQRFPSGLIWQWLHITDAIAAGGSRTLTLPFAFPASVLCAHATARNGQQTGAGTISVVPSGLQSVVVYNNGSAIVNGAFLSALGF